MTQPAPPQLSACVIAQNESRQIERCLLCLAFADELVVLDGGSSDETAKIAARCGARVHFREFDTFIEQKNHLVGLATGDWVLVVDADEVISPELAAEIRAAISRPLTNADGDLSGFWIPRMSFYLGQWIRHCGWYPEWKLRLFRRGRGRFIGDAVHEGVAVDGHTQKLTNHIEHYSYGSISEHIKRIDRYSSAVAGQKFARGRRSSVLWALLKSVSKFFITYVYHRGFLDGRAGLVVSVLAGYYNFLKYIKLWELERAGRAGPPTPRSETPARPEIS